MRTPKTGGGLLFYIKNDVRFQPVNKMERFGLETHTIRVQLKRRDWVKITNCYLPRSSTQETRFDPSLLPSGPDSIIVGDLNSHSHLWDSAHGGESDTRGQEIEDWLLDQDLTTLNDGSSTLTRKRDGKKSCPDLTVVGSRWATKCMWKVGEPIGASDHEPILTTLQEKCEFQPVLPRKARWKTKGVDMNLWAAEVDRMLEEQTKLKEQDTSAYIASRVANFVECLTTSAEKIIGKVKPKKSRKHWMNPHVRAKVRKRNLLRKEISTKREEWRTACKEANDAILEAKKQSWNELLSSALPDQDPTKVWQIVKSLNGTPCANSPNEALVHNSKTLTDPKAKANQCLCPTLRERQQPQDVQRG